MLPPSPKRTGFPHCQADENQTFYLDISLRPVLGAVLPIHQDCRRYCSALDASSFEGGHFGVDSLSDLPVAAAFLMDLPAVLEAFCCAGRYA